MSALAQEDAGDTSVSPDLKKEVMDWADALHQAHQLDLKYGPDLSSLKPYVRKKEIPALPEWQRKNLQPVPENWKGEYRRRYYRDIPKYTKVPDFETPEEAMAYYIHLRRENINEKITNSGIKSFKSKMEKMPIGKAMQEYPEYFRFQPKSFKLPSGEDFNFWGDKVDKYLKCYCDHFKHIIGLGAFGYENSHGSFVSVYRQHVAAFTDISEESFDAAIEAMSEQKVIRLAKEEKKEIANDDEPFDFMKDYEQYID